MISAKGSSLRLGVIAGSLLLLAGAVPALAQSSDLPRGELNSSLSSDCGVVPANKVFAVEPAGNDDTTVAGANAFFRQLQEAGYQTGPEGRYQVTLETRIDSGHFETRRATLGQAQGDNEEVTFGINVWSSSQNSLLARRSNESVKQATKMMVGAFLRDRETRKVLWTGDATAAPGNWDHRTVAAALAGALADVFGCPARRNNIPLTAR